MSLTLDQLQSLLDANTNAIGNVVSRIRRGDGSEVTNRQMAELLQARTALQQEIRITQGKPGSRVRLAQHRRGDTPIAPTLTDWW